MPEQWSYYHQGSQRRQNYRGRPRPGTRTRAYNQGARPQHQRPALSEKDRDLLEQRKTYKKQSIIFYSASYQSQFLRNCLDKGWRPKGLRVQKRLMTISPNSTNIKDTFEETLQEATDCLTEQLADHLVLVAKEAKTMALQAKQTMNTLTQRCSAGELITHERFLSATEININKHEARKRQDSNRKLKELAGRPSNNEEVPNITRIDIYRRRATERTTVSAPRPNLQPPRLQPHPRSIKKKLPTDHGKAKLCEQKGRKQPPATNLSQPSEGPPPTMASPRPGPSSAPDPITTPRPGPSSAPAHTETPWTTSREPTTPERAFTRTGTRMKSLESRIRMEKLALTRIEDAAVTEQGTIPSNPEDVRSWNLAIQQPLVSPHTETNSVLNLSSRKLSKLEEEVLQLGLKFAPTPRKMPDPLEFFERYYHSAGDNIIPSSTDQPPTPFRTSSTNTSRRSNQDWKTSRNSKAQRKRTDTGTTSLKTTRKPCPSCAKTKQLPSSRRTRVHVLSYRTRRRTWKKASESYKT